MAQNVSIFDSLSEPQKRAVKLRDKLKYMKADHLDGYINGLGHHEPPNYRFVDGRMQPCFIEVTLLEEANRFDLGNVLFSDEIDGTQTIRRAYFFMEGCCVKMRTLKRLPLLEENLESLPIYACIVKDMEPLFEAKYRVLQARVDRFNAIRRAAHNFAYLQEACGRTEEDSAQQASHQEVLAERTRGNTTKRGPGSPIRRHATNKRSRIGLDAISDEAKSAVIDKIPNEAKISLFNSVAARAFPSYEDLMTAAWNVVSVYSNVGTDFPSLHKAIDDLKSVLEESDGVTKVRVTGELQFRHDFTRPESRSQPISEQPRTDQGSQQSSRVGRHRRTTPKAPVPQRFEDLTGEEHDLDVDEPIIMYCNTRSIQDGTIRDKTVKEEEISVKLPKLQAAQGEDVRHLDKQQSSILPSVSREDMDQADSNGPAPAVQAIRHHAVQDQLVATNDAETPQTVPSNSGTLPAPQRSKSLNPTNLQSIAIPEISRSSLPPKCASSHAPPTSSPRQPTPIQQDTISPEDKPSRRNSRDLSAFTLSELKDKYKSRKLKMIQTFGGSANIPKAHKRQMSQIWDQIQEKEKAEGEATNKPTSVDKGRQVEGRGVAQIREAEGRGQIVVTKKKKKGMYVYSHDSMEERYEDADIPGTGGMSESEVLTLGGGLGSSILGTKKTEGKVPVAVMVHNRN